jgi:hypothetical protein
MKGAQLRSLKVEIDEAPGSQVIEYRKVEAKPHAGLDGSSG